MPIRLVPGFVAYKGKSDSDMPEIARFAEGQVFSSDDQDLGSPILALDVVTQATFGNPRSNRDGFVEPFRVDVGQSTEGVFWVSDGYPIFQPFLGRNGTDGSNVVPTGDAIRAAIEPGGDAFGALSDAIVGATAVPIARWADYGGGTTLHRGGGASLPQSTREGLRGALAAGCTHLDVDMRLTADGVPVLAHDNLMDPYTNKTGLWIEQQSAMLGSVKWDAGRTVGGSWGEIEVSTIAEILDEFGGKVPMIIEPKNQVGIGEWTRSLNALAPLIHERGLAESVMVGLYGGFIDTHLPVLRSHGLMVQINQDTSLPGYADGSLIGPYEAAGVEGTVLSSGTPDAVAELWAQSTVTPWLSPIGRRWRWAERKAQGIDRCIDDYAVYLAEKNATVRRAPYRNGQWGTGDIPASGHKRPKLLADGLLFDSYTSDYQCMLMGDFAPLPDTFTMDFTVDLEGMSESAPWFGFNVCAQDDQSWKNAETDPTGYLCFIAPRGGNLAIWQRVNGAAVKRAETTGVGAGMSGTGTLHGKIVVSGEDVSVSLLDGLGGSVLGTATFADTAYRGGYLHVAAFKSGATAPKFTLRDVKVT